MHVRFSVSALSNIYDLEQIVQQLGRPVLIFNGLYFYGNISSDRLGKMVELKEEGCIMSLWFAQYVDDLPAGLSDNGG